MKVRACFAIALLALGAPLVLAAPSTSVLLWPQGAPGSEGKTGPETVRLSDRGEHIISNIHAPSITPYLPARDKAAGAAIVVVPGGGHAELWMDHEGYRVAQFLADHGVAAFILKYRLSRAPGSTYTVEGDELADLQRAIRSVRSRAGEWQIDPLRIGVMGFSAGGELATLAAINFTAGKSDAADAIERQSSRPDFAVLVYPGNVRELAPSSRSPPAFMLCGADDEPDISQGLANLYVSWRKAGLPAEIHIYAGVGHGFGLRPGNVGPAAAWPQQVLDWLDVQGFGKRR
jgi:endo-1,4-beta-xylanase